MVPLISVLIPAYNAEKYIGRALRSILNQTLGKDRFEVIVVNDASTDRTAFALDLFNKDVVILHNEKNLGLPASLNKAIHHARGKYIIRMDADDYVSADYLHVMQLFLEMNKDFDAVACDYVLVDNHENILQRINCEDEPIGCGIMFRTDQLIEIGMYDKDFLMHEDQDLRIRFEHKYKITRIPLPLYRYRRHGENMTNNKEKMDTFQYKLASKHFNKNK